jgi:cysteine desulfurase
MNGYFDNAASMQILPQALLDTLSRYKSGNPSSTHLAGQNARRMVNDTRQRIAEYLGCGADRVYFTSGATEAANLIIQGYLSTLRREGRAHGEIIVSAVEHPAVYRTVKAMAEQGYRVHELPVSRDGCVSVQAAEALINSRTAMICLMAVNNETGAIQPVNEVARIAKRTDPGILVLCDAVQHFAKLDWPLDLDVVDALFMSAHKIGADKGVGCFYLNGKFKLTPIMHGGTQEQAYRPGTENVFGIGLLGEALSENIRNRSAKLAHIRALAERLTENLSKAGVPFERLVAAEKSSPYILTLAFPGVPSRQMMADLAVSGFCVSQGSACSSQAQAPSRVLSSMRISSELLNSTIRFSFSFANAITDVDCLTERVAQVCGVSSDG